MLPACLGTPSYVSPRGVDGLRLPLNSLDKLLWEQNLGSFGVCVASGESGGARWLPAWDRSALCGAHSTSWRLAACPEAWLPHDERLREESEVTEVIDGHKLLQAAAASTAGLELAEA